MIGALGSNTRQLQRLSAPCNGGREGETRGDILVDVWGFFSRTCLDFVILFFLKILTSPFNILYLVDTHTQYSSAFGGFASSLLFSRSEFRKRKSSNHYKKSI